MKSGVLLAVAGTALLAGCGSPTSDPSPTATHAPSPNATSTAATIAVKGSATPAATAPPPTLAPVKTQKVTIPANATAFQKGQALMRGGDYTHAAAQFQQSIASKQQVANSYAGEGTAYIYLHQYPKAYRAYGYAAKLEPTNADFAYYAAYTALYSRNLHAAVDYATNYIRLRPKDARGYHVRFLSYGQLLMAKRQVTDAQSIVRLQPRSSAGYNDLGIAYANAGQYKKAVQYFTGAIRIGPPAYSFYINRAFAEQYLRQSDLVLKDLHTALSLAPDAATRAQLNQALAGFEKSLKKTPSH